MINDLLSHGYEFTFPQVMRIARMHLGACGAGELPEVPWQERIRVRPDLSLAFPAADVARVERTGQDGYDLLITTTFLGLYGSSSPLPNHYTEDLMDEVAADSSVSRDFLDILHQRLYQLYFQCWSKYRLFVRVAEEHNPRDRERLFCLIGLGEKELRDSVPDAWSLVRYAGLLTQFPRSAEGLQTLLRDALGVRKLDVEQCILRRVPIPRDQQMRLGISGMCLGMNSVLGSEISDRMGKFRIHIGPLSKKEYDTFLPGTQQHDKLAGLIRLYITDPLEFDLQITLAAGEARPIRLGDPNGARLGWNSWCFAGDTIGETSALFPIAHSAAQVPSPAANEVGYAPEFKEPSSLIDYYQQELSKLRDLAAGYAASHPELASMISGRLADPGVERLFEGVAFLNANLQQKLNDDFPEVIHDVIDAIQPNYLRPIPATTIIVFSPKRNCTTTQTIPVGTELKSIPVDGTACTFTTRYPVEIHPLTLIEAAFAQPSGKPAAITLRLKLANIPLADWNLKSLRFFLAGETAQASDLYLVLMRYVKRIVIGPTQGGQSVTLDATHLKAVGFKETEALFPGDDSSAVSQQLMHEYFIQPDKFLFVDLLGWEKWGERGEGTEFEISFELDKLPFELHRVSKSDFVLFATPAVNVFAHRAEPIILEDAAHDYPVIPAGGNHNHYHIYALENVMGLFDKTVQRIEIIPNQYNQQSSLLPTCQTSRNSSHQGLNLCISVKAPSKIELQQTILNVWMLCSNGILPDKLKSGDIRKETDSSPNFAEFTNCKPVRRAECFNTGNNTLWKLYSLYNLNIAMLNVRTLRTILERISQSYNCDYMTAKVHTAHIQGITDFQIKPADELFGRTILRGWEISIKLNQEGFRSIGDSYQFGSMLDHFLRGFVTEACFTKTIIEEVQGGIRYGWPAKMGRRPLL